MQKNKFRIPATWKSFIRFSAVGVIGFGVDAGVLSLTLNLGMGLYLGRVISFISAVTATWYLNRRYTFSSKNPNLLKEWGKFVSANTIGGLINYATYACLVSMTATHYILAVGVGSVAGLMWNYNASRVLVFSKRSKVAD